MANAEQLAIVRQGVDVWNAWRHQNPHVRLDLERANLSGVNLSGVNLSGVNLFGARLHQANLRGADLQGATLIEADLGAASLQGARLHHANLGSANLREASLDNAGLTHASLGGAGFTQASLTGARLDRARLERTILRGANLREASFHQAILHHTILTQAILTQATLHQANLFGADLTQADLTQADLTQADFTQANLTQADLTQARCFRATFDQAILREARLHHTKLHQAILRKASLDSTRMGDTQIGATLFADVDLRPVHGLATIQHASPSHVSIDTLYRSQGQIPEIFLRGCGVPDSMIEYARSLVAAQRPIDYYSVFISYSSQDEAVAQRLHADLQAQGVRCWFAPHDLAIGAPIVRGIDEAIRIYDKLLIILSEASVNSRWVEFEVSTALHRELEQGRTMLFPIRLDDAVLSTSSGWAAQLRTRHIGDFRGWKDHDRYQAAFTRLLRDLKAKDQAGT